MRWSHVLAFVIGVTTTAGLYEANRMMQKDTSPSAKVTKQAPPAPSAASKRAAALRAEAEDGNPNPLRRKMPTTKPNLLREKSLPPIARAKRAEMASKFRSLNPDEREQFRKQAMGMLEEPEPEAQDSLAEKPTEDAE